MQVLIYSTVIWCFNIETLGVICIICILT